MLSIGFTPFDFMIRIKHVQSVQQIGIRSLDYVVLQGYNISITRFLEVFKNNIMKIELLLLIFHVPLR